MITLAVLLAAFGFIYCAIPRKKPVQKAEPVSEYVSLSDIKAQEKALKQAQKQKEAKEQAEADIPFIKEQLGNLYALLDLAEAEYSATTNANRQAKFLRQINALNKQIHTMETKLNKARRVLEK